MKPRLPDSRAIKSALLLTALLCYSGAAAQQIEQASYTDSQAQAGATLYQQNCATCHLTDLQGAFEAPALNDGNFRNNWSNRNVTELQDLLGRTMPPQAPGSLSDAEYSDLVAFLLAENAVTSSDRALAFNSTGVAFLNSASASGAAIVQRIPRPGQAGTIPSPGSRNAVPEIATIYRSERAITRSWRPVNGFVNVSDAELAEPAAEDWTYWRRSPNSHGYSPLDQINKDNVGNLTLAWVWGMAPGRSQPGPLIRNGIVYLPNFGNVVQALDGRDGTLLWEYQRTFPQGGRSGGLLRTLAMWQDLIYVATTDAHLVALDARTGAVRWDIEVADEALGYSNTTGPIVADGIVINGIPGCGRFYKES